MSADKKAIKIFIAYSQKDRTALDDLRTHAAPLLRQGNIEIWYDGEIVAGEVWDTAIKANLHAADIILLLLSSHSLASEYFYNEEVQGALKRHEAGAVRVVPIILSACLWKKTPLANLQGLPTGMTPISKWPNHDDAWNDVLIGLSDLIDELGREVFDQKTPEFVEAKTTVQSASKASAAEEHAWEFTTDNGTPAAYKKFLDRFPDGFYAATAREHLDLFEADETAWEFASQGASDKAIQKYLDKFPEGLHVTEAGKLLAAFEHDLQVEAKIKREQAEAERRRTDPFYDLMIPIKGGMFKMGDTFGDGNDGVKPLFTVTRWEKPGHTVVLSDFSLCKYPVTQGLWKAVMGEGNNPAHFKGDDSLPVEMVSWEDAQKFIAELNNKSGQQYRLPTEAEWEYAARGGGQSKGYKYSGSNNIEEVAWFDKNAGKKTHPVGGLKPNELGLFDMSGNVWEWCHDWYDDKYYESCKKNGIAVNPAGPDEGVDRVIRGGSWVYNARCCRVAYRGSSRPPARVNALGFRLAL